MLLELPHLIDMMNEVNVRMTVHDVGKYVAVWSRERCFPCYCLITYVLKWLFIHTDEEFQLLGGGLVLKQKGVLATPPLLSTL